MRIVEFARLDAETLNDCLTDVPASDVSDESNTARVMQSLRHFWSSRMYVDHAWKGMDDNEAWAA